MILRLERKRIKSIECQGAVLDNRVYPKPP